MVLQGGEAESGARVTTDRMIALGSLELKAPADVRSILMCARRGAANAICARGGWPWQVHDQMRDGLPPVLRGTWSPHATNLWHLTWARDRVPARARGAPSPPAPLAPLPPAPPLPRTHVVAVLSLHAGAAQKCEKTLGHLYGDSGSAHLNKFNLKCIATASSWVVDLESHHALNPK